jgi:hypothetical protein
MEAKAHDAPARNSESEAQLIKTIRAHIAAGDRAAQKSSDHYIAAGQHLKTLKANHGGTWTEWEALLRDKVGIGKSRASELMAIADGRKTVEQVQDQTNVRKLKHRKSLRSGTEDADDDAPDPRDRDIKLADRKALYAEGVALLEKMDPPTRRKFFRFQQDRYLADFDGAVDGFKEEIEALKRENANLRKELDPGRCEWVKDDGGRAAAGYGQEHVGDCGARAVSIATGKPYAEVFEALKAAHASYIKRHPRSYVAESESRRRKEPIEYGCSVEVMRAYMKSIGWQHTEPSGRYSAKLFLRADMLPKGRLVVLISGHYVAVVDGKIFDTYDSGGKSGKRTVEGYWSQPAAITTETPAPTPTTHADDGLPGFLRRNPDNSLPTVAS